MVKVLIVIEGGVVQNVICAGGAIEYVVKDFDNINAEGGHFDPDWRRREPITDNRFDMAIDASTSNEV